MKRRLANRTIQSSSERVRGIVALEAILWIPVLVILLFAIVEMGLMMVGVMHATMASRIAARQVSQLSDLGDGASQAIADSLRESVDRYLENAGYGPQASRGVRLQHNIGSGESVVSGDCEEEFDPPMPMDGTLPAVRVVVMLDAVTATPNSLAYFGFDIANTRLQGVTTFPYLGSIQ